jgi:hypothetical protein
MAVKTTKTKETATLNARQEAFCRAFAVCNNGAAAYQEAYPDSGLSAARTSASAFLKNPNILAKIDEYREIEKAKTVLLVHELKKRIRKMVLTQLDQCDIMLEIVMDRVNFLKQNEKVFSERKLLDLSKIRSGEIEIILKIIDALAQLEGLDVMESTVIDILKQTEAQLELN